MPQKMIARITEMTRLIIKDFKMIAFFDNPAFK
jgi:hypothetical protein